MFFGLTRENLSHNALGIGLACGCIAGGFIAPIIVAPHVEEGETNTAGLGGGFNQTTQGIDAAAASSLHARGYLAAYIAAVRSFTHITRTEQWWVLLVSLLLLLSARLLYQWFFRPFEYTRGYTPEKRLEAAYLRLAGAIPPGYPNTWYKVCDEFDIPASLSQGTGYFRTDVLGETILLFRAPEDHGFVGDAIRENEEPVNGGDIILLVESSLNGLDPRTDLHEITKLPGLVRWPCKLLNRMIFAWHHDFNHDPESHDPAAIRVPAQWDIPLIEGMEKFVYHGRVQHEIACHIQEIPENGADLAHLDYIHGDFLLSWLRILRHTWSATWDPMHEPVGHVAKLILNQKVSLCGIPLPGTSLDSTINQIGPGLVQLIFPTPFGRVAVIETITPICHTLQRANNVLYAEKTVPRFMAKVFLMGLVVQFERDLPIWNFKHFLRKPLILKEDGPILRYRRWMRQFYSNEEYQKELQANSDALMKVANE